MVNISVLVAANSTVGIPVSCVEAGRWRRRSKRFSSAPFAGQPTLRARKAHALRDGPLVLGRAQADVWDEVATAAEELHVSSPTLAHFDSFRAHEARLHDLAEAFPIRPGQCGSVLTGGENMCLDALSRPEAFGRIWPKLLRGYLLDSMGSVDCERPDLSAAATFLTNVLGTAATRSQSVGRGEDLRLQSETIIASGLELDGEVIQISAYACSAAS